VDVQSQGLKFDRQIAIYDLCKKYNILFIADEVRQGAGKTGKFFCYEHLGPDVKPDIVAMGKSIAVRDDTLKQNGRS
jgi:ornithine--oxo-acid transaminase